MTTQTAEQIAAKWSQNLAGATSSMQAGVQGVRVAPGVAAARNKMGYVQGVTRSQDKWASNVARVSLGEWQDAYISKGLPRIAQGAQVAQPKFTQFMGKLLPFINSAVAGLPPRGDLNANIARSAAMIRAMSTFAN